MIFTEIVYLIRQAEDALFDCLSVNVAPCNHVFGMTVHGLRIFNKTIKHFPFIRLLQVCKWTVEVQRLHRTITSNLSNG